MREIVIDTETTGLDPLDGHRIVELGAVELVDHRRRDRGAGRGERVSGSELGPVGAPRPGTIGGGWGRRLGRDGVKFCRCFGRREVEAVLWGAADR
jgi:hypothetical protein